MQQADHFLIPLLDGAFAVGQVVVGPDDLPNDTALCLLTDRRAARDTPVTPITMPEMISVFLVHASHLQDGTWPVIGFDTLPDVSAVLDWRTAKAAGFPDQTPHDPAVIEAFANACFGLFPWNGFAGADFFDQFLITPERRPPHARIDHDR